MRLTVQFDLHSRWCSVGEVGGVDGGREERTGSSTEGFGGQHVELAMRVAFTLRGMSNARGRKTVVVVRVTFLEARFSISRHSINCRGRIALWGRQAFMTLAR